jgi:predicted phosphodiesterase
MLNLRKLSRRELLRFSAGTLLSMDLWPGSLAAGDPTATDSFHFLVVNDTHYIDAACGKWLERAVRQMQAHEEKIDLCLLVGDLANNGKASQIGPVKEIFTGLKAPNYVVIGNHDYLTQQDRKAFTDRYPGRLNYKFEHRGWQWIGLDTTQGTLALNTTIAPATFQWLDEHLPKLDKKKPTVLFTHFPMGQFVPGRPKNAEDLLARFKDYNLSAVFNGHFHALTERQEHGIPITTNRCCSFRKPNHDGSKEKGYFLCTAHEGKISRKFIDVPIS